MVKTAVADARGALRREVRELVAAWRTAHPGPVRSDAWLRGFDPDFSRELARRGLLGMTWPRAYGGSERRNTDRLAVTEELLRLGAPVAAHWIGDRQIGPAVLRYGSPQLRKEILPLITSGEAVFCLGMSEPTAGSDLAAVRTRAEKVSGGYRVHGHKIWTSHAHRASHAYLLARTSQEGRKHEGLTEFIVDMDTDGITVTPIVDLAGEHHFNEVLFNDVFVPGERVLGQVGKGWRQVVEQLSFERGGAERVLSTYPILVEILAARVPDRSAPDTSARLVVGSLVARLAVLRRMAFQVARDVDRGEPSAQAAAALKYLGHAFEIDVLEAYRTIGLGADADPSSAFGQAVLASPGFGLRGGAAEVLLGIIAKQEARA
jgi:alkylation response protein AidB-like acyl-CoA dehydrogenase